MATAESLTGGRLGMLLTETPGSSGTYVGGVVAYATRIKSAVLGVPGNLVDEHGVVSAECAKAMAGGVRELTGATYALSTTGVAGPDRQEGKAPGTVFVGLAGPDGVSAVALELVGLATARSGTGPARRRCRRSAAMLTGRNRALG